MVAFGHQGYQNKVSHIIHNRHSKNRSMSKCGGEKAASLACVLVDQDSRLKSRSNLATKNPGAENNYPSTFGTDSRS